MKGYTYTYYGDLVIGHTAILAMDVLIIVFIVTGKSYLCSGWSSYLISSLCPGWSPYLYFLGHLGVANPTLIHNFLPGTWLESQPLRDGWCHYSSMSGSPTPLQQRIIRTYFCLLSSGVCLALMLPHYKINSYMYIVPIRVPIS